MALPFIDDYGVDNARLRWMRLDRKSQESFLSGG